MKKTVGVPANHIMNSMQTCNFITFYFMKNSFCDICRKWILPTKIRAVNHPNHIKQKSTFF